MIREDAAATIANFVQRILAQIDEDILDELAILSEGNREIEAYFWESLGDACIATAAEIRHQITNKTLD